MQLLLSVQGDTGKHGQKDAMKILNRLSRSFRNTGKASKHEHVPVHIFNWCFKLRFQTHVDRNESMKSTLTVIIPYFDFICNVTTKPS